MQLITQFSRLIPLTLVLLGLVSYNFMSAQWTGPSATAPGSNTSAPINVSSTTQSKAGNFSANILSAATSTWSPRYCDGLGQNCFDPAQVNRQRLCPSGQFMRGVNSDGTLVCATATTTAPSTCTTQSTTVSGCYYGSGNPSCPAGWTASGPAYQGGRCSTNNDTWYKTCIRTVCS